ncbi:hypothetical protein [Streptomyces sp. NPDC048242]|uniref:hypothetical protein n=1 Tax=Streptomyces sp. NPDC048242 TaxID=3155026 RepID=UPI0033E45631
MSPGPGPREGAGGRWPWGRRDRERESGLPEELRGLGRSLDTPGGTEGAGSAGADGAWGSGAAAGAESMVERVLERILAEQLPVPVAEPPSARERLRAVRRWIRLRRRSLAATLCGLLTVAVATPPARAALLDWFGFGGVEVRYDPSAVPSPGTEVPGCGRSSVTLGQAARRAGFAPLVPDALGAPDAVTVSGEPRGRFLVTLCWREQGRTVRLDEFPAWLDVGFTKTVREPPEWVPLNGTTAEGNGTVPDPALWFPRPHQLSFWLLGDHGERYSHTVRTAGPTLLWTHASPGGEVTLRLEGVPSKSRAVEIARSLENGAP